MTFNSIYEKLLIQFFGITDNIHEAGYILRDGRFLDFSGRHFINDPFERKYVLTKAIEHHDLFGVNYNGFSLEELWPNLYDQGTLPVVSMMALAGVVRCNSAQPRWKKNGFLTTCHCFSEGQYRTILRYFEEDTVTLTYLTTDGYIVDDFVCKFVTYEKLKHWVDVCQKKTPSKTLFSTAAAKAPYSKVDSCAIADGTYPAGVHVNNYPELKKRQYVYQPYGDSEYE